MRLLKKLQLFLCPAKVSCDRSDELQEMQRVLDSAPGLDPVLEQMVRDVTGRDDGSKRIGREGITAEQVLKLGLLRKRHGLTYRGLAEATSDSMSMRQFLNLAPGQALSKSVIQSNLKLVKESTWVLANECLLKLARDERFEKGEALRGDTTMVESNIHYPTDASLLNDVVRVLCREMDRAQEVMGKKELSFINHTRRAKAKLFKINNLKGEDRRHPFYLELIRVTRETVRHAEAAVPAIENFHGCESLSDAMQIQCAKVALETYIPRAKTVIDQAYRRIVKKEQVPSSEKIVSIFEEHTDIIVKGFRDVVFGHKVMLSAGTSGMILSLVTLDGNPKDSTLIEGTFERHMQIYGSSPRAAAFDGCFASAANRDHTKQLGVENLTFSKNRSLNLNSLLSSKEIHKPLRNFRAGIEGCISFLKRIFGFSRVLDRTKTTFHATLQMGAFAYNLTLLARMRLAQAG